MLDTSGNGTLGGYKFITFTTPNIDETPPAIIENTLIQKTDTTAKLHLTTSELLNKIRIRYRVVSAADWTEQTLMPVALAFDVNLAGLLSGQAYEYQYILDDKSDNQSITEWVRM